MLGHCDENAGGKSHVEDAIVLLATALKLAQVLLELDERLVFVVLARDVRAVAAELLELLLQLLCGGLDVRLDALEELLVVHLCARIADDANVLGKEVVAVLEDVNTTSAGARLRDLRGRKGQGTNDGQLGACS